MDTYNMKYFLYRGYPGLIEPRVYILKDPEYRMPYILVREELDFLSVEGRATYWDEGSFGIAIGWEISISMIEFIRGFLDGMGYESVEMIMDLVGPELEEE
jgi:hypothetical protein